MDDRFEREFYRSPWRRVLPLGPYGIQPYVRTSRSARGLPAGLYGLIAPLGALARGLIASGCWAASGLAARPMPLPTAPRVQG